MMLLVVPYDVIGLLMSSRLSMCDKGPIVELIRIIDTEVTITFVYKNRW
jgi:hypothetical protein